MSMYQEKEGNPMLDINAQIKGKTLLITGGTGSFGSTVLRHFITSDIGQIQITQLG